MKFLLAAVNAKYIHSNPAVYSLRAYARRALEEKGFALGACPGKVMAKIEIGEYTINHQSDQILQDIYRRKPDFIGFSCYIWNISQIRDLVSDLHQILPEAEIWLGGPEVSYDAGEALRREPALRGVMRGEGEETFARLAAAYLEGEEKGEEPDFSDIAGITYRETARKEEDEDRNKDESKNEDKGRSKDEDKDRNRDEDKGRNRDEDKDRNKDEDKSRNKDEDKGRSKDEDKGRSKDEDKDRNRDENKDKNIRQNPDRKLLSMDEIPFYYDGIEGFENRIVYYESSRGCPFSCSYCLSSIDKSVRFRSLSLVKRELQFFLDHRVPQVKFVDRTFNCRREHTMEIWQYLLDHDNGVTNFHFEVSADLFDREELELIEKMRPGLIQLEIGVQSTNPDTIGEIRRKMDLSKLREAVAKVRSYSNTHQHLDLIAGLPWENFSSFLESFDDVYRMKPDQLQLGFLKVLKGSYMETQTEAYGLKYRTSPPYEVLETRWLSFEEVTRLKELEEVVEVYYNSGQFGNSMEFLLREFESPSAMYLALSACYRDQGLFAVSHNRLARYEILYRFFCGLFPGRREKQSKFRDCLVYDLYLRENLKSRPSFASDQTPYKRQIREFFEAEEKEPRLLLGYEGYDSRQLGKMAHLEVLEDGRRILFDYKNRSPLSRNARAVELRGEE